MFHQEFVVDIATGLHIIILFLSIMEGIMQDLDNNSELVPIEHSEMKKIAKLAMLNLKDDELEKLQGDFSKILNLFTQLEQIDVNTVVVSYEPNKLAMTPRSDKVIHDPENNLNKIGSMSPYINKKDGYFNVPPVIETE